MNRTLIALALVTACSSLEPETGALVVCLDDDAMGGDEVDLAMSGTVASVDDGSTDCTFSLTVEDGTGTRHSLGWTVLNHDGDDMTPSMGVGVGDSVELLYRWRMVWGDVAGFALFDADGLVAAGEEGTWGGALQDGDVPGLSVSRGADVVASAATDCEPLEGHEIVFDADTSVAITPITSSPLSIEGAEVNALAIRATTWGEGRGCAVSDTTDHLTWALYR